MNESGTVPIMWAARHSAGAYYYQPADGSLGLCELNSESGRYVRFFQTQEACWKAIRAIEHYSPKWKDGFYPQAIVGERVNGAWKEAIMKMPPAPPLPALLDPLVPGTVQWAKSQARCAALLHAKEHPYLPQAVEHAALWEPHEWIVSAILSAYNAAHEEALQMKEKACT